MSKKSTVSCGKFLDVAHVETIKQRFMSALEKNPDSIEAHTENVERADSAGIQLILAVKQKCQQQNIIWQLPKASEVFTDTVTKLGLTEQLCD